MTQGRPKGSRAEREVAGILERWWSRIEPGCRFVRTPLSGGWSSAQVRGDLRASGDIMTTARRFPFTVEVKRREGWSVANFLAGRPSPVWGWWLQAQAQAREQGGEPMLWLRRNREKNWMVVVRYDYFLELGWTYVYRVSGTHRFLGRWPRKWGHRPVEFSHLTLCSTEPNNYALVEREAGGATG